MNKENCLLITLFLVNVLSATAQNKKSAVTNDKEQLIALEYSWLKAEFSLDTAYLSTLMDDSFMAISAGGTSNKQEELLDYYQTISQRLRDSVFVDSFKFENTIVNLYGNTAVITLVVHTFRKDKGVPIERKTRFYDVWIKHNGKWKAVASQGTRVME